MHLSFLSIRKEGDKKEIAGFIKCFFFQGRSKLVQASGFNLVVIDRPWSRQRVGSVWFGALFRGLQFSHQSGKVNASRGCASKTFKKLQSRLFRAWRQTTLTAFIGSLHDPNYEASGEGEAVI